MGRRQEADLSDRILPLSGLIVACLLFIPGVRRILGEFFWFALCGVGAVVIGLIIRIIWWKRPIVEEQPEPLLPIFIHSDEERAQFRAMMGVKEQTPTPIKRVKPHVDDATAATDSSPNCGS